MKKNKIQIITSIILFLITISMANATITTTLDTPENDTWQNTAPITFGFTPEISGENSTYLNCSLWGNFSGAWGSTAAVNTSAIENASQNNISYPPPTNGTFIWNAQCYDNGSLSYFATANYTVKVDTANPTISLDAPADNSWDNDGTVTFQYTPADTNLDSCILYTNSTGPWTANITNSPLNSGTQLNNTLTLSEGSHLWNVQCNDSAGNTVFNETNYTINVDTIAPGITNQVNYTSDDLTWTFQAELNESGNCSLFGNWSGSWIQNETKNVTADIAFNFTSITLFGDSSTYKWRVNCSDTGGNEVLGTNYSFTVGDEIAPGVSNQINYTTDSLTYIFQAQSNETGYCTLWGNWTGSWEANETKSVNATTTFNFTNITYAGDGANYLWGINCSDSSNNNAWGTNYSFAIADTTAPTVSNQINYTADDLTWYFQAQSNEAGYCTLWGNWSGTWAINDTEPVGPDTAFNFTPSITFFGDSATYKWGINCSDTSNNNGWGTNYTFTVGDSIAPGITNQVNYTTDDLTWTFQAELNESGTCSLFGNWSGVWVQNESQDVNASTSFNFTSITLFGDSSTYKWRVNCSDTSGNEVLGTNYSFTVGDEIAPGVSNQVNYTTDSLTWTFQAQSNETGNCSLWGNWSGAWAVNETKTVTADTAFNFTNITYAGDGASYLWNVYCNDSSGNNVWGTNYSFVVADNTAPTVSNQVNYSADNLTWYFQAQSDETGNCTLWGDWTGSWAANETKTVTADTAFNFTNITYAGDGASYLWGVNCSDESNNEDWGTNYTFTVDDIIAPIITSETAGSITSTAATITWTTNEAANSTVMYGTTTNLTTGNTSLTTPVTIHSIALSSLTASTTYYYNVTSCDSSGNCNTTGPHSFATIAATTTTSSSSSRTSTVTKTMLTEGTPKVTTMRMADKTIFTIEGITHYAQMSRLYSDHVIIEIHSDWVEKLNLSEGDTGKADVNRDGIYDIEITLEKIYLKSAKFTFELITEKVPSDISEEEAITTVETKEEKEATKETPTEQEKEPAIETEKEEETKTNGGITAAIIAVILIGGLGYFFYTKKK